MKFAKLKKYKEKIYDISESNDINIYYLAAFLCTEFFQHIHYDIFMDWLKESDEPINKNARAPGLVYGLYEDIGKIYVYDSADIERSDGFDLPC